MACITKRRGRYVIDFYDNQGKRQRQTLKAGTTKKKARERIREIEDQLDQGAYIPDKKIPLFKDVVKDWLKHKKPNLRGSTWSVYEGHTKKHFTEFESLKINRITTASVERFITDKQNQKMNILTLRKILVSLGQIFAYAIRHGYTSQNPLRDAERPKGQGNIQKSKIRVLTPGEIKALLDKTAKQKYKTLFMLAIMSGARQGELFGLKWSDIDWVNSQIHIQRTFNNQAWYDVKTKTSNRKVDLGPAMITELKKWKLACLKNSLGLIFRKRPNNPIFTEDFIHAIKVANL